MLGRKGIMRLVLVGGVGLALALGACARGVSQTDFDAVKQQLSTKEQEAAAAKQQVTSLQAQLKPAAPQEPKRLEAKITIVMGDTATDMFYATAEGVKGGPFRVPAGKTVGIHLVNKGPKEAHEVLFGQKMKLLDGKPDSFEVNLFEKVAADVFVYPSGTKVEVGGGMFKELELEIGAEAWIRATFPAELKGEWEIACVIQEPGEKGHYEQGMKAKLIIE